MDLPIDLVPGSTPPQFKWKQSIDTPVGKKWIDYVGTLPPNVEIAVAALVCVAKKLADENKQLKELLSKRSKEKVKV